MRFTLPPTYLLLSLIVTGCATGRHRESPVPTSASASDDAARLHASVDRWFEAHLRLNPFEATEIGDHRYDDTFGNSASPEYERAVRANWEKARQEVLATSPDALSPADRLTREIFLYNAEHALKGFRYPRRLLPLDQMYNPLLQFARFGSGSAQQPFDTPTQHAAWLRRASGFSTWVDSAIAAMREGQEKGVTHSRPVMEKLLGQVKTLHSKKLEQSVFWRPLERLEPKERATLEPEYRRVFGEEVMPAIAKLQAFLANEHIPRCRTTHGWSELPNGREWYAWHVEESTTTALTPEEIHALGKSEMARIADEMKSVQTKMGVKGSLQDFFRWAREEPRFYETSAEDLLDGFRKLKRQVDARIPALFSIVPKATYEVRAVEAFRAASAPGGSYERPSEDGTRPGIFYVNTFNLKAQPRFNMQTLSLHEGAPGHHFQVALQQELDLPRFRRFLLYNAFVEGWALYAETLGPELGLFEDPMDYYGHLAAAQYRAIRLVVDTGLHAKGWTREQAIRFMLENSSMAESAATAEVERYMVWPGQALGYKVGQLRITAIRKRAEEALGETFDLKRFHATVLSDGALPLGLLERKIDRLIEETRSSARTGPGQ